MPGRPAGRPPSIRPFPSSTDLGNQPQAFWRKPTRLVMSQGARELTGLPEQIFQDPAQPLRASAEPTWPSAGYCAPNRFPRRGRNPGTASPQRFLRAEDNEAHTVFEFAN